jgi:hypothetical protein
MSSTPAPGPQDPSLLTITTLAVSPGDADTTTTTAAAGGGTATTAVADSGDSTTSTTQPAAPTIPLESSLERITRSGTTDATTTPVLSEEQISVVTSTTAADAVAAATTTTRRTPATRFSTYFRCGRRDSTAGVEIRIGSRGDAAGRDCFSRRSVGGATGRPCRRKPNGG